MLLCSLVLILLALCMTIMLSPFGGCLVVSDNFLSTKKKKKKKENLSGMTLVLFVNLEIGARYLLVVSIGLLLLLLGFPLRRPFQM